MGHHIGVGVDRSIAETVETPYCKFLKLGDDVRIVTVSGGHYSGRIDEMPDFGDANDTLVLSTRRYVGFVSGIKVESDTLLVYEIAEIQYACKKCQFAAIGTIVGVIMDLGAVATVLLLITPMPNLE